MRIASAAAMLAALTAPALAVDATVGPKDMTGVARAQVAKDLGVLNISKTALAADLARLTKVNAELKTLNANVASAIKAGNVGAASAAQISLERAQLNKVAVAAAVEKSKSRVSADLATLSKSQAYRDQLLRKR